MDWPRDSSDPGGQREPSPGESESNRWRERFRRSGADDAPDPPAEEPGEPEEPRARGSDPQRLRQAIEAKRAELLDMVQSVGDDTEMARVRLEADREIGRIREEADRARSEIRRAVDEATQKAEHSRALLTEATERADGSRTRLEDAIDRARRTSAEAEMRLERMLDGLLRDLRTIGDRLEGHA